MFLFQRNNINILNSLTSKPLVRFIKINFKANKDPYFILGVSKEDKMSTIKKKYFHLAKKYHPDVNPDNEKAAEVFL